MSTLSATSRHEYYAELGGALPPPVQDTQEDRERRLTTAVETFDALRPGDAYEAHLVVTIVLCGAHAAEALRLAGVYRDDFAKMTRCRAQASSMMRGENSAKRTLERERKLRLATAAVAGGAPGKPAAASAAPACAGPQASAPASAQATMAAAPRTRVPPAAVRRRLWRARTASPPAQAGSAPAPSPEAIAQAEVFAHQEMVAAARIRQDGGITPQSAADFRRLALPTDPAVVDALVRGNSDVLTLLDEIGGETLDVAA